MNVAMIGLGKLGLPVACAMVLKGHTVHGYDTDTDKLNRYKEFDSGLYEPDINGLLEYCLANSKLLDDNYKSELILHSDLGAAIRDAKIIFIAVPTPSKEDGSFSNEYVLSALKACCQEMLKDPVTGYKVFSIISTVLPGTVRNEFYPFVEGMLGLGVFNGWGMVYNAQFIAMGSVVENFLNPEFVLVGGYGDRAKHGPEGVVEEFYEDTVDAPILHMTWEEAETTKLVYNTFIGQKIITGNAIMEMCEKQAPHADCDVVVNAISQAYDRIISPWYLKGGMGDGGPCHPRDQRALSYWARRNKLSVNPFEFVGEAREKQSLWLAKTVEDYSDRLGGRPVILLGKTFKHDTNLMDDSPAVLLYEQLKKRGYVWVAFCDPHLDTPGGHIGERAVYVLCTRHEMFKEEEFTSGFPKGSVVIDPWGWYKEGELPGGVKLIRLGRRE